MGVSVFLWVLLGVFRCLGALLGVREGTAVCQATVTHKEIRVFVNKLLKIVN